MNIDQKLESHRTTALLKPCREYFAKNQEYLEQIKEVEITR